ncbi:hypothetical protein N7517_005360 [Penicillium concentricum]|uniref:NACHT domain-containing protein n=1 Tax=Penicillium concentricum TaxID=293559 RepID=A0A9W9SA11_9EURO|nr:uncharacterized protein N7517_005360 [Penicillium concentricum]KAJ5373354.1 hypothetical protein N7517_005360 [Penicillium concentricum]
MEAAEQKVLTLKGLIESERVKDIHDGISMMLITVTSTAEGVHNIQARLEATLTDLERPLVRITDQVSDLHGALKESERNELLTWVSPIPAQQHYREALASVLFGSGEWLYQEQRFVTWRDSSSSETFWLHGIPGCGKTKLAAVIIQHLRQQSGGASQPAPIAHFFCSRNLAEPERTDPQDIIRSLVKQVSLTREGNVFRVRSPLLKAYKSRQAEASHTGERPAPLTVEECVEIMCEIGRATPFTIVIDALDECTSQQRRILLQALEGIRQRCRDVVKIFVSSRYEEDIAVSFKKGDILEVTSQTNYEDLKQFVEVEVETFVKRWSTMHGESIAVLQKLGEDIKEALMTGAQGMFLWVTLQLESISDTEHVKDIESIRQVLTSLPPTLRKSYEAIYKRIESMGESTRRVAIQSFQWLLCAKRKLSVSEFVAAMGMSSSPSSHVSARSIRDYCCNLVIIDNESDTFRLAHLTVREFLETLLEFSIDESNATVANRCLGLYIGDNCESDILSYATWYWPAHVEQLSGSPQRAAIKPALLEFFTEEEHFEDWLDDLDALPIEEGPSWSNMLHRKLAASFASPPSALFMISCFGLEEVLESSDLARMMDVNQRNKHDTSALYMSARWGHVAITQRLLDLGAAVDAPGSQYGSALQAACFAGQEEIVNLLLDKGASFFPDESSLAGKGEYSTPLQAALANGHDGVAQLLIDRGCKLTKKKQFDDAMDTASFRGNVNIVERLLSGKAGVFTPNTMPDPLQVALFGGKARQAKRLIQEYGNGRIDEEIGYFGNALAAAIASRKLGLVQLVVDAGANLDTRGRFGSPLRSAVISDHLDIARYLLKKGVSPNTKDEKLGDPLQAAASLGNVDMMLLLLDHGAHADGCGGHFGNTLQAASFNGHEQCVRLLIERGAALDRKYHQMPVRYRDTLQAAVYAGHENIVEILFAAGAKLNRISWGRGVRHGMHSRSKRITLPGSRTATGGLDIPEKLGPLEVAARKGNAILVKMLLAKGARIDAMDDDSSYGRYHSECTYTASQIAGFWGHLPVVELLLYHGADINVVRQTLGTPLQAALEGGHFDVAELLLSRGAEIDKHWGMFGSCLQVYSERGHLEIVKFLLDRGANIEDSGGENGNALQVACDAGHIDIVLFLLGKHADVRASGKNLGNALQAASAKGHLDIVKLLLRRGIEVDEADTDSETALCLAANNGHEQTVLFLLQQEASIDGNSTLLKYDASEEPEPPSQIPRAGMLHKALPHNRHKSPREDILAIALHLAASSGHESTVSILLENGANTHHKGKLPCKRTDASDSTPLFAACFCGHASTARRLFQHDPWSYISHNTFMSAVKTSLARGKKEIATMLVQEAILAGFKAEHFDGAFRYACANGYAEFLKQILEHFVHENLPTALLLAAEEGRGAVVEVLLQNGADVDIPDEDGNLALDLAIKGIKKNRAPSNWIEVLMILLCAGADTDDLSGKTREVFPDIAKYGRVDILRTLDHSGYNILDDATLYPEALVQASADGNIEKINYMRSKHVPSTKNIKDAVLAAINWQSDRTDRIPTIKTLLSLKTPLLFDGNQDFEPLVIASEKKHLSIVAILLQHARHGRSVVETAFEAAIRRNSVVCIRLILESQSWEPAERLGLCSRSILKHGPCINKDILAYLFDQGVSPNTRDPQTGATLLYIAATKSFYNGEAVRNFVAHGAALDLEGGEYGTALHGAAVAGNWKSVDLLLSSGADVNAQNGRFGTPLMVVMLQTWEKDRCRVESKLDFMIECFQCHRCCARKLLDWGADVDAEGGEFGTALRAAQKVGNKPGIKMLLEDEESDGDNSEVSEF